MRAKRVSRWRGTAGGIDSTGGHPAQAYFAQTSLAHRSRRNLSEPTETLALLGSDESRLALASCQTAALPKCVPLYSSCARLDGSGTRHSETACAEASASGHIAPDWNSYFKCRRGAERRRARLAGR